MIAEAFQIYAELLELEENNLLDFGFVRVNDINEKRFTIKNNGLYDIEYKFDLGQGVFNENFKIWPMKGVLGSE